MIGNIEDFEANIEAFDRVADHFNGQRFDMRLLYHAIVIQCAKEMSPAKFACCLEVACKRVRSTE